MLEAALVKHRRAIESDYRKMGEEGIEDLMLKLGWLKTKPYRK